ncbi:alpha/beta hydrolase [Pseudoxanthomonas sp. 10H]|uniref:alpha/beta hydrolase n=1 Tax=Pseudoxanthomonas sp. 10H TaxID=3242729 RepID=UPI0035570BD8
MAERRAGRLLLAAALVALLGYAAILLLMHARQRSLVYYPAHTRVAASATDFELRRDDVVLRGWQLNPGRTDALLYFGGNAERIEASREDFAAWFGTRTVYLVAYRGYGASDGEPEQDALLADALALYDDVRRRHPGGDIGVVGRSLGSGVAAWVASQRPVSRLTLVTPFDGLAQVARAHYPWLPVDLLLQERYPSAGFLHGYRGRVLVLRAGHDTVVPPASTDRLVAALPVPPQVVMFPDDGHNTLSGDPAYGRALADFMR